MRDDPVDLGPEFSNLPDAFISVLDPGINISYGVHIKKPDDGITPGVSNILCCMAHIMLIHKDS